MTSLLELRDQILELCNCSNIRIIRDDTIYFTSRSGIGKCLWIMGFRDAYTGRVNWNAIVHYCAGESPNVYATINTFHPNIPMYGMNELINSMNL